MNFNILKAFLSPILILTLNQITSAQKLPSEQKESVYAPADVKTDGKPAEWTGKFQAKNNATLLTYVMANDEENLYLTIQANETQALGKIFYGGISLAIRSKKDKKSIPVKITYPLVTPPQRSQIVIPLRDKTNNADSVAIVVNTAIGTSAKAIAIAGFTDITDPDVSVYNDLGIKALVQVDNTRTMTFEYRLPLKYIKHLLDENSAFDYSIIVNGARSEPGMVVVTGSAIGGGGGGASFSGGGGSGLGMTVRLDGGAGDIFSPTDLKATYTLAKK
jgi:hypothetical protein